MNRNSIIIRSLIFISILLILITPLFLALRYLSIATPGIKYFIGYIFIFISIILTQKYLHIIIKKIYLYFNIIQTDKEKEFYRISDNKIIKLIGLILMNIFFLVASISIGLFFYGLFNYNYLINIVISMIITLVSYKGITRGMNYLLSKTDK